MSVCVKKFKCTNVGELRQALKDLDGELPIEAGFGDGVTVWHASEAYEPGMTKAQVRTLSIDKCMLMDAEDDD